MKSLPQITVTGAFTLGQAIAGNVFGTNYYGIRELYSRTIGRHSLKLGGEFSLEKAVSETTLNNYGTFSFQGNRTGSALADFFLGLPQTMNQDAPINKSESTWYTRTVPSGRFSHSSAADPESRPSLRSADAAHRSA